MKTTILLLITFVIALQINAQNINVDTVFSKSVIVVDSQRYNNIGVEFHNKTSTFWNSFASGGKGNLTIGSNWTGRGQPSDASLPSYAIRMKPNKDKFEIRRSPSNHQWLDQLLITMDSTTQVYYVNINMNYYNIVNADTIKAKTIIVEDTLIIK